MINLIWACMAIIGIVYAMFNGTMADVNQALFESANEAVTLTIGLVSMLVFWLGFMRIAVEAGILRALAKVFSPIIHRLFPEIPKGHIAIQYILSNITANIFGLGNAATPMGIKAMEEMKKLSHSSTTATRSMITFLAINTSGITLIPTTVIAIRIQYNSISPTEIVGTTIIATIIATTSAILLDRYFYTRSKKKSGG